MCFSYNKLLINLLAEMIKDFSVVEVHMSHESQWKDHTDIVHIDSRYAN